MEINLEYYINVYLANDRNSIYLENPFSTNSPNYQLFSAISFGVYV